MDERPEDGERGIIADLRGQIQRSWRDKTPAEKRRSAFQVFLCILAFIALVGGCSVMRSYGIEKRQKSERENLPGAQLNSGPANSGARSGLPSMGGGAAPGSTAQPAVPGQPAGVPATAAPGGVVAAPGGVAQPGAAQPPAAQPQGGPTTPSAVTPTTPADPRSTLPGGAM